MNDELLTILQGSNIALNALDYRRVLLQTYENSCKSTQKRIVAMERLRTARTIQQEKVDLAVEDMATVKKEEQEAREAFKSCSEVLRSEVAMYRGLRNTNTERVLDEYVRQQIGFLV